MRILLIPGKGKCARELGHFCLGAFKSLGIDGKIFLFNPQGFKNIRMFLRRITERIILWELSRFKPDLLLVIQSGELRIPFLEELKKRFKIILAHWWMDDPILLDRSITFSPFYDYFFTVDPESVSVHRSHSEKRSPSVFVLHLGCDPHLHRELSLSREEKVRYGSDVTFVGPLSSHRANFLRKIVHFDLKVWSAREIADYDGKAILKSSLPREDPLSPRVMGMGAWGEEMVKVYNASKIVLNFFSNGTVPINMRVFEVMGCGAFLLTERRALLEVLFKKNEEFVSFEKAEELPSLIDYYLKNEKERLEIARRGQQAVYREHTYSHRMQELLDFIREGGGT